MTYALSKVRLHPVCGSTSLTVLLGSVYVIISD
jgi:hypothetical protein